MYIQKLFRAIMHACRETSIFMMLPFGKAGSQLTRHDESLDQRLFCRQFMGSINVHFFNK
jgi:hypothetical protein